MGEESLIGEAYGMVESAFDELREYEKDRDLKHIREASEKGWSAVVLVTDYLFGRLGVIEFIQSTVPDRKERWGLYTHERRVLLKELQRHVEVVKEKGMAKSFESFGFSPHAWGFYEGAIEFDDLKEELSEVRSYIDAIKDILPELERRKDELCPILIRRLEARWKADRELAKQRERLMKKWLKPL